MGHFELDAFIDIFFNAASVLFYIPVHMLQTRYKYVIDDFGVVGQIQVNFPSQ